MIFTTPETIAAIDLGSNSFHMIVARVLDNQFQVIDKLQEMVRLGAGLDPQRNLAPEVAERAPGCLERFGQRIRSLPQGAVRAVGAGTNTLRQVRDSGAFQRFAEQALPEDITLCAMQLAVLLRLSVLLHRARSATLRVDALLEVAGNQLILRFPEGWLETETHPLPRMELKQEAKRLKKAGFRLKFH